MNGPGTLELARVPPRPRPAALQTRASAPAVQTAPVDDVQVADEAGFAYLSGDIDFGATGRNEIFQNIKYIVLTEYFSVPLDREFGMDYSMVDKPMAIAEAVFSQEVAMRITLYEPRAQFRQIDFTRDELVGKLSPAIKIALLTTEELPSTVPAGGTAAAAVAGPPGVTIEEVDLPGFYESLIEMARVPGPPGPVGQPGVAATIETGTTTTGAPGTPAEVTNSGTTAAAVFDFVIPKGDKGDQGTGVNIKGTVPNSGSLPTTGNQPGDMWIASDTGHGWTWDGDSWNDVGPIQGPPGPSNVLSVAATTTGAPGTAANVTIAGTSPSQSLTFVIPRGDVGAQGIQGEQGIQGVKGDTGNTGSQGNVGAAGPSNILTVSGTTTGAPGTNASVVIAGTSPAQSLAFTIPRGDVGPQGAQGIKGDTGSTGSQGSQGIQGVQGPQGANAFTTTTANFTVPAVGASVLVTVQDASWVTVGQMVVVQTAGGAPADAYSFKVTAKAGNQLTLQNIASAYAGGDMLKSVYDTDSDGVVDRAASAGDLSESVIYTYQDHFLTGSDGSYTNWTAVAGTGAAKAQVASVADHPGVYALTTGTQAGAAATGYGFITSGNAYLYGTGALAFRCVFKAPATKPTSTAANLSKIFLGLGTQPVNGVYPGADFVGFVFDPSSGMANAANNWGFLTRKASVNTYTDTGFAYSTTNWVDLSFYLDPTGASFKAYTWAGTAPAKSSVITANVPLATTPLCLVFHVVNGAAGTTSYQGFVDCWEVAYRGSTVVSTFRGSNLLKNF